MRLRVIGSALAVFALSCSDPTGPGEDEILSVVSGNGFSCALVGESVYCWGRNDLGQLGRGLAGDSAGPGLVTGAHRFRLIAAGDRATCGVTVDNGVYCWGSGRILGFSNSAPSPTLVDGSFPASITSIGVGYAHGCVRASGGGATCFGSNALGELGNGTVLPATGALGATAVSGHSFSQLSVGAFHTCGVEAGDVVCWGTNFNFSFGPGLASGGAFPTPTVLSIAFDVTNVEAGSAVTCVKDLASQTLCWGANVAGQLGRGPLTASAGEGTPALISNTSNFASIALSRLNSTVSHACGIAASGTVSCWGAAEASQLGRNGTEMCTVGAAISCGPSPAVIGSALSYKQLAPGRDHTCGLTTDGEIYCWGSDVRRQLGGTVGATTTLGVKVIVKE
jgi:alpha-tubulin suppressor-like RCC1 family protein